MTVAGRPIRDVGGWHLYCKGASHLSAEASKWALVRAIGVRDADLAVIRNDARERNPVRRRRPRVVRDGVCAAATTTPSKSALCR